MLISLETSHRSLVVLATISLLFITIPSKSLPLQQDDLDDPLDLKQLNQIDGNELFQGLNNVSAYIAAKLIMPSVIRPTQDEAAKDCKAHDTTCTILFTLSGYGDSSFRLVYDKAHNKVSKRSVERGRSFEVV